LPAAPFEPDLSRVNELTREASNWRLVAQADVADADAVAAGVGRGYDRLFTGDLAEQQGLADALTTMFTQGMKRLNDGTYAPSEIVDVVRAAEPLTQAEATRKLLRSLDYLTGVFKSYAVMTPGFVNRNFVGGVMNNWLGLVNVKSYLEFYKADRVFLSEMKRSGDRAKALAAVGKRYGARAQAAYDDWLDIAPAVAGGQAASFAGDVGVSAADAIEGIGFRAAARGTERGLANQGLRDNTFTRAFFYFNTRSEYKLRGPMAWDEFMRKQAPNMSKADRQAAAVDRIYTYHFDYSPSGSSRFERNVLRRAIPFYVWMANNIPLQIKGLVTRPKVGLAYLKAKQNIEELSDEEGIVPGYFRRLAGIRLPFTDGDGNSMYFMPDLPIRDLGIIKGLPTSLNPWTAIGDVIETNEVLSSVNPWFKVPAETMFFDRQVFTDRPFSDGYVEMPPLLTKIPGLTQALQAMGQVRRGEDGKVYTDDKLVYMLESAQPWLGRINRLFPAGEGDQAKRTSTLLSIFLGVGFRTNTWREKSNELFRLQAELDGEIRSLMSVGQDIPTVSEIKKRDKVDATVAGWEAQPDVASFLLQTLNTGNTALVEELGGFGPESAAKLVNDVNQYGSFTDLRDLAEAKNVSSSLIDKALERLSERRDTSLDFATATVEDLEAMPGIGPKTAPKIFAYAQANGGIRNLGELRRFGLSRPAIQKLEQWLAEEREFQRVLAGVR